MKRDPLSDRDLSMAKGMDAVLAHRGPDGSGTFRDAHVALFARRLAIIDLRDGNQPLYNEDGSLVLVANGEIYNALELRGQLEDRGHDFRTGSDCETIVHLYEEFGTECVQRLRGMFAFALWDGPRQRLLLARDRMGEKPLYLHEQDGRLVFASELKALVRSGYVSFELNPTAIDLYFHYQYVPEPATPIKGVRKLPAASVLIVDVGSWRREENSYWSMENAPPIDAVPAKIIRSELETISEIVVRSDVPVGVALSGGLDSSAIAALAARKYPGTMNTFSVGYPGRPKCDERSKARRVADYLRLPFHELELSTTDMVGFFPELVYWRDDPIADMAGYGYYAVMKLAREHNVLVMLQGQGGDELFWGYPWVRRAVQESLRKSASSRRGGPALKDYLQPGLPEGASFEGVGDWVKSAVGLYSGWKGYLRDRTNPTGQMIFYDLTPDFRMARDELELCYTAEFRESLGFSNASALFTFSHPWKQPDIRLTSLICQSYLLGNGITQGDRLSMAASVEMRLPLLDYKFVEAVIGLRKVSADHHLPAKAWFKSALQGLLPEWVIEQPKRAFAPPVREWHAALFLAYGKLLEDGDLVGRGILKPASARQLAAGPFPAGAVSPLSFKAMVLEMWCRQMLARSNGGVSSYGGGADLSHPRK